MENEVVELLDEEVVVAEVAQANHAPVAIILGVVGVTAAALLFKFRHKINAKIENNMVKKLTKKGYVVQKITDTDPAEEIFKPLD